MWDLPRTGNEPKSSSLAGGFLTTGPPEKSQCLYFYLETKEQDDNSKNPSSFGMSFSVGQPGSKSILQKKTSFVPSFQTGFISFVICFPVSSKDTAWIVCIMIRLTTAVAFRAGQLSQIFGVIIWSFPLTFTNFLLYFIRLHIPRTGLIITLCDTGI